MFKVKKMYLGIIVFIMYLCIPMIFDAFLKPLNESGNIDFTIRAILNIFLLIIFIFLYKNDFKKDIKKFKTNFWKTTGKIFLFWFLSLVIMALCSLIVNTVFSNVQYVNDDIINAYFKLAPWFMVFTIIFYSPIIEEIVFRKAFKDIIKNKWFFIIFSSLVFAFYHIGYNFVGIQSILSMIPYIGLGIVLAISYYKTDNLYVPIIVHVLYDLFVLIINII